MKVGDKLITQSGELATITGKITENAYYIQSTDETLEECKKLQFLNCKDYSEEKIVKATLDIISRTTNFSHNNLWYVMQDLDYFLSPLEIQEILNLINYYCYNNDIKQHNDDVYDVAPFELYNKLMSKKLK